MWIHIGILFFVLAAFPDSIESNDELMMVLNRHKHQHRISNGICYYGNQRGRLMTIPLRMLSERYVMAGECVIGVSIGRRLRKIYDENRQLVFAVSPDFQNTEVYEEDAEYIPYNIFWDPTPYNATAISKIPTRKLRNLKCPLEIPSPPDSNSNSPSSPPTSPHSPYNPHNPFNQYDTFGSISSANQYSSHDISRSPSPSNAPNNRNTFVRMGSFH